MADERTMGSSNRGQMMFYIWNKKGFKNLKRKRISRALEQGHRLFYGIVEHELRGLDSYAVVEDMRIKRGY